MSKELFGGSSQKVSHQPVSLSPFPPGEIQREPEGANNQNLDITMRRNAI
jgi:hypothetical protein